MPYEWDAIRGRDLGDVKGGPGQIVAREDPVSPIGDRLIREVDGVPSGFFYGFPVRFRLTRRIGTRRGQGRGESGSCSTPSGRPGSRTGPSRSCLSRLGSQPDFGRAGWILIDCGGCRFRSWIALRLRRGQDNLHAPTTRAFRRVGAGIMNDLGGWSRTGRRDGPVGVPLGACSWRNRQGVARIVSRWRSMPATTRLRARLSRSMTLLGVLLCKSPDFGNRLVLPAIPRMRSERCLST
jgi:hypothetical protein